MGKPRKNIFAEAAEARDKEQEIIEYDIMREEEKPTPFKKLAKEDKRPTTVILSRANHHALKRYSLEHDTTFSELINQWIEEKCGEFIKK